MFDRFTDLAKKAITVARKEAQRLRHETIGTEDLLFGLADEGSGVAVEVLRELGVDLKALRSVAGVNEKDRPEGGSPPIRAALPFSPEAKAALGWTLEEASELGHDHIGTEHLLLGLLREASHPAARLLLDRGVGLETVRSRVQAILDENRPSPWARELNQKGKRPLQAVEDALLQALLSATYLNDNSLELTILGYLEAGGDPLQTFHGLSLLEFSVFTGSAELFEWLLDSRFTTNPNPACSSALLLASAQGFSAAVRMLLQKGVPADTVGNERFATPLIAAAANGHRETVEALLERGARRDFLDPQGLTAADHAGKAGHQEVARLIQDRTV
jgi:hypothetical protein